MESTKARRTREPQARQRVHVTTFGGVNPVALVLLVRLFVLYALELVLLALVIYSRRVSQYFSGDDCSLISDAWTRLQAGRCHFCLRPQLGI